MTSSWRDAKFWMVVAAITAALNVLCALIFGYRAFWLWAAGYAVLTAVLATVAKRQAQKSELERLTEAAPDLHLADHGPLDFPEDPADAPILTEVIREYESRYEGRHSEYSGLGDMGYWLGWQDCIVYFRKLANGPSVDVRVEDALLSDAEQRIMWQAYSARNVPGGEGL